MKLKDYFYLNHVSIKVYPNNSHYMKNNSYYINWAMQSDDLNKYYDKLVRVLKMGGEASVNIGSIAIFLKTKGPDKIHEEIVYRYKDLIFACMLSDSRKDKHKFQLAILFG